MADVQRAGRIGRHKFEHDALTGVRAGRAKLRTRFDYGLNHRLFGRVGQANIDEARTGDFECADVGIRWHGIDQLLRQLARIFAQRLGQLHGDIARGVAVRGLFRALKCRRDLCVWCYGFECGGKTVNNAGANLA